MKLTREQCYAILGLSVNADMAAVRNTYRRLAKKWHPDVNPSNRAASEFRKLQQAYDQIRNGEFRQTKRPTVAANDPSNVQKEKEQAQREKRKRMREEYLRRKAEKELREAQKRNRDFKRFLLITLALILFNLGFPRVRALHTHWYVMQEPDTTSCEVTYVSYRNCAYRYEVKGKFYTGEVRTRKVGNRMVSKNGMPLFAGQRFKLLYRSSFPESHFVDFKHMGTATFNEYLQLARSSAQKHFQHTADSLVDADCFVWSIYRDKGLDGWADVVFHETSWLDNIRNNKSRFESWLRSPEGKEALTTCAHR